MRKQFPLWCLCIFLMLLLLLTGCSKENAVKISVNATTPIEVDAEALNNVSVTLPEGLTRETVSDIQHDFIQNGKQVGGIVIVDIPDEMLDSPLQNMIEISDLLGQQLMQNENPDSTALWSGGGNAYAYMEVYTGGDEMRYVHYLFRGEVYNYDVWFDLDLVKQETMDEILAAVSSNDITAELNKSVI